MQSDFDNTRSVAVDREYYWRSIESCPHGVKVQLINRRYGVATYGQYSKKEGWWTHWAPLPVFRKDNDGQEPDNCV